MNNPLAIPDIIAKVIENLDTKDLVKVSYLSKTWRLEAQRKLYQNRSTIIYNFFKPYLNVLRLKSLDITADLLSVIPFQEFIRFAKFRYTFSLDIKVELLSIRDQCQGEHKRLKKICKRLDKKVSETFNLMDACEPYSEEYWVARKNHNKLYKNYLIAKDQRFELWKNLVNYEY